MARAPVGAAFRQMERIFGGGGTVSGLTEAQLLDRFATTNDDAAFEAIVRRHGPAVLAVCRRLLHDPHEAEDAFQATFLVLARRAGSIRQSRPLGPWLVGVSYRIASKARVASARRHRRESVAAARRPESVDAPDPITIDLGPVLWEELNRLPNTYRAPVILCWVEGHSHDEAADLLRWPVGTVKGRLHRAKQTLQKRLSRRGITAPAAGLSAWFSSEAAAAIVPPPVLGSTLKSAVLIASGASLLTGTVPAGVALLARGALQTMFLTKLSISAAAVALVSTSLVGGFGVLADSTGDGTSAPDPPQVSIGVVPQDPEQPDPPSEPRAKGNLAPSQEDSSDNAGFRGDPYAEELHELLEEQEDNRILQDYRLRLLAAARRRHDAQKAFFEAGTGSTDRYIDAIDRYLDAARAVLDAQLVVSSTPDSLRSSLQKYRLIVETIADRVMLDGKLGSTSEAQIDEAHLAQAIEATSAAPSVNPRMRGTARTLGDHSDSDKPQGGASETPPGRSDAEGDGPGRDSDPASKAIRAKLELPLSIPFENDTSLDVIVDFIRQATADTELTNGIPIYVDETGMTDAEQTLQSPIKMSIDGIPLKTTLWLMLRQLDLAYSIIDGVLIISTREHLDAMLKEDPIFLGLPEPKPARRGLGVQ